MARRPRIVTVRDIIAVWPPGVIVVDLCVKPATVRGWHRRNSIPLRYWTRLAESASVHGLPVTSNLLRRVAAARLDARPITADGNSLRNSPDVAQEHATAINRHK